MVSLYQLSFTYISNNVEEDAKTFATAKYTANEPDKRNSAQASYLDSIGNIPVVSVGPIEINYNTAKGKEFLLSGSLAVYFAVENVFASSSTLFEI